MAQLVTVDVPISATLRGRLHRALKARGLNLHKWAVRIVWRKFGVIAHTTERRGAGRWELVATHVWPPVEGLGDLLAFAARNAAKGPKKPVQLDLFNEHETDGNDQESGEGCT